MLPCWHEVVVEVDVAHGVRPDEQRVWRRGPPVEAVTRGLNHKANVMLAGKVDGADDVLLVESLDGVGAGGRHPPLPRRPVRTEPVGRASLMGEPAGEGLEVVGVVA